MAKPMFPEPSLNRVQERAVARGIDLARLPQHVAMIMDGNGRYAKKQGLGRLWGHHKGYKALRGVLLDSSDLGIRYLTVYAFSSENWARPDDEVRGLMELIEKSTRDEVTTMMRNNVRMRVAGRMSDLPDSLRESFEFACRETSGNTGITFTLAVNYGGRAEIVDAVRALVASGISPDEITEEDISKAMYQPKNPDPDVIVRTAGEMRLSNFMIYQAAYAELVVTPVTWPEFKQNDLFDCIADFQNRERKFGGLEII
jgi:undecaprenyl diphosphate synthase